MCSTTAAQIARICLAIEELASRAGQHDIANAANAAAAESAAGDDVADRLAAIWAMIAEADPELAKRLPGYLTAVERAHRDGRPRRGSPGGAPGSLRRRK